MSSFLGRGNEYIELVKVLYCKLPGFEPQTSEVGGKWITTVSPTGLLSSGGHELEFRL